MTVITMSRKEQMRLRVLIDIGDGRLSVADATGLSELDEDRFTGCSMRSAPAARTASVPTRIQRQLVVGDHVGALLRLGPPGVPRCRNCAFREYPRVQRFQGA
jgi:hypothetical protein